MHYISADLRLIFLSNNFSSVLIVMQVVAVGLCFVDDAICGVCINGNQKQACLEFNYSSMQ